MDVQKITSAVIEAAKKTGITNPQVALDFPRELARGDFSTNVAMAHAKERGDAPLALAQRILENLVPIGGIQTALVAPPGFINFVCTPEAINESLTHAQDAGEIWGEGNAMEGKSIMIEYTQPNPFKPFHIGHLMSNSIGESLVRLYESQSAKVVRANYQGDVGPHVAKAMWGMQKLNADPKSIDAIGKAYTHGAQAYETDPGAKEEIDALNKLLYEKSDAGINDLYAIGRKTSLDRFEELYRILGSHFDRYYFESETAPLGKAIVEEHPNVFPLSEGARVLRGEEHGLHTRVFITAKGFPTYEAKELGLEALKDKEYPDCDELVVVTAVEQKGVFDVVTKAIELVDEPLSKKLHHVVHGMMLLESGKMSSRVGNVVTGESLLAALTDTARVRAKESRAEDPDALAQQIAVGAIKFQILRQGLGKNIVFDEVRALSLEGDSGPYIQYTHARCASILEKGKEAGFAPKVASAQTSDLERMLVRFPAIVARAAQERAPHVVANYLIEVAALFNTWYAKEQILDGSDSVPHKLAVVEVVRHTLRNGLFVLGISAPDKM